MNAIQNERLKNALTLTAELHVKTFAAYSSSVAGRAITAKQVSEIRERIRKVSALMDTFECEQRIPGSTKR